MEEHKKYVQLKIIGQNIRILVQYKDMAVCYTIN